MRYIALALFVTVGSVSCAGLELAVSLDQLTRSLAAPVRPKAAVVVFEAGTPPVHVTIECVRLDSQELECRGGAE